MLFFQVSISSCYQQKIFAIGKDGMAYIRYMNNWQLLDGSHLKQVEVSPTGIWAVSISNVLYRRSDVQPLFPEGKEWVKVCDGVMQVYL